jgi:hypothetical protein
MKTNIVMMKTNSRYPVVILSIFLLAALVSGIFATNPQTKAYISGNTSITAVGPWTQISFGPSVQRVNWEIMNVSSGSLVYVDRIGISRIDNYCQNSVIERFSGKHIKVAQVYTFSNTGVDASIVIKNTGHTKATLAAIFVLKSGPHNLIHVGSIDPGSFIFDQQNGLYTLNRSAFEITEGNINVNWQAESNIFHTGVVSHSGTSNILSLPFGPIVLVRGQTYTIDPSIRSMAKMWLGGVGEASQEPAVIGSFSIGNSYPSTFENGTQTIKFDYSVVSMGSYSSAKIGFFIADPSYYYYQIGSTTVYGTGTYSFSVNPNYIGQWEQFDIAVWYPYFGKWDFQNAAGHSFIVFENTANGYSYPNQGYLWGNMKPIRNSAGTIVGDMFASIQSPAALHPDMTVEYQLMSGIVPRNNDYQVNRVAMYFNYTGNSLGQSPLCMKGSNGVQQWILFSSYLNYQNSSFWSLIDQILWKSAFDVASALTDGNTSAPFAVGGGLNTFTILGQTTQSEPSASSINLTYTQNAGWGSIPCCFSGGYYWNALGTKYDQTWYGSYNFKPSYMFDVGDEIEMGNFDNNAKTPYVVDYFQYTIVYSIFNTSNDMGYNGFPSLYTGSYTVSAYLPEAVVTTT